MQGDTCCMIPITVAVAKGRPAASLVPRCLKQNVRDHAHRSHRQLKWPMFIFTWLLHHLFLWPRNSTQFHSNIWTVYDALPSERGDAKKGIVNNLKYSRPCADSVRKCGAAPPLNQRWIRTETVTFWVHLSPQKILCQHLLRFQLAWSLDYTLTVGVGMKWRLLYHSVLLRGPYWPVTRRWNVQPCFSNRSKTLLFVPG